MPAADDTRMTTGRLLLGARLRSRRLRARLQLAELAERAGLSQAYLSDLERGNRLPTLPILDALANALGTTAAGLLRGVYPWGSTEMPEEPPAAPRMAGPGARSSIAGPRPTAAQPAVPGVRRLACRPSSDAPRRAG